MGTASAELPRGDVHPASPQPPQSDPFRTFRRLIGSGLGRGRELPEFLSDKRATTLEKVQRNR